MSSFLTSFSPPHQSSLPVVHTQPHRRVSWVSVALPLNTSITCLRVSREMPLYPLAKTLILKAKSIRHLSGISGFPTPTKQNWCFLQEKQNFFLLPAVSISNFSPHLGLDTCITFSPDSLASSSLIFQTDMRIQFCLLTCPSWKRQWTPRPPQYP